MAPLMSTTPRLSHHSDFPSAFPSTVHFLLHVLILGICAVSLAALWSRAPKSTFIVFLLWTLAFYSAFFVLAWHGIPSWSILSVFFTNLRIGPHRPAPVATSTPPPSRPLSTFGPDQHSPAADTRSPYTFHQPSYRRALSSNHNDEHISSSSSHAFPRSIDAIDDEDEETQQRRIEQEMDRRDVSIVTVPKRKLWITNPN